MHLQIENQNEREMNLIFSFVSDYTWKRVYLYLVHNALRIHPTSTLWSEVCDQELSIGGMMKMRQSLFKQVSAREILFDGFSDPLLTVGSMFAKPGGNIGFKKHMNVWEDKRDFSLFTYVLFSIFQKIYLYGY